MLPAPVFDPLLPLAKVLDPILDPAVIRATRSVRSLWAAPPFRQRHASVRERALDDIAARYARGAQLLASDVRARRGEAVAAFDELVARAVDELRGEGEARATRDAFERAAHLLDRVVYRNASEWLDDPSFDGALRVRTLDRLDRMNEALGSYDAFVSVILPLVESARAAGVERPVVVDLASGHAGFALRLAQKLERHEGGARVIATDRVNEYLDIGRAHAREAGLDERALSFEVQDALDLRGLEEKIGAPIDVVCCTQTVHHFPPGFVARMLGEAASVARHGAVIVDGERNIFALMMVTAVAATLGRGSLPFLHDAFVSMRRMYTEQELALIALLAPGPTGAPLSVDRGWVFPGHAWVAVH